MDHVYHQATGTYMDVYMGVLTIDGCRMSLALFSVSLHINAHFYICLSDLNVKNSNIKTAVSVTISIHLYQIYYVE